MAITKQEYKTKLMATGVLMIIIPLVLQFLGATFKLTGKTIAVGSIVGIVCLKAYFCKIIVNGYEKPKKKIKDVRESFKKKQ